jgi:hypothetical protein
MKTMNIRKVSTLVALLATYGVSGCGEPPRVQSADFATLPACLQSIERNSGMKLKIITDKPDKVSGNLSNGAGFGCEQRTSGTKGTYFNGWYFVQ